MRVIVTAEAPWSGAAAIADHRARLAGENGLVHSGVVLAEHAKPPQKRKEREPSRASTVPSAENGMAFAASVIAETLSPPPPPATEELVQRLGAGLAQDAEETQLRDRFA